MSQRKQKPEGREPSYVVSWNSVWGRDPSKRLGRWAGGGHLMQEQVVTYSAQRFLLCRGRAL